MRNLIRSFILLFALIAGVAQAAPVAFEQSAFDMRQKEGKPTLIAIHADWCPTCKAQAPAIDALLGMPEYRAFQAVRVNFDTQKDAVEYFKSTMQSTLIVYKDGKEVGRSTGESKKESIAQTLYPRRIFIHQRHQLRKGDQRFHAGIPGLAGNGLNGGIALHFGIVF